jgi:hypothetical protein
MVSLVKMRRVRLPHFGVLRDLAGLLGNMRILGPLLGWRYWRIGKKCQKDPLFVEQWAKGCLREAKSLRLVGDIASAETLESWAGELLRHVKSAGQNKA